MKHFSKLIPAILLLTCVISCQVLEYYPHNATSTENLSKEDLRLLHTGLYQYAQYKPCFEGYFQNDMAGGDFTRGGGSLYARPEDWIKDCILPTRGWVSTPYIGYYALIYQINSFIKSANKYCDDPEIQTMLGTAHFFRGLTYYNLVSKYRNVIIITEPSNKAFPNSTEEEGWKFIESELQMAIDLCPSWTDKFYVSKQAAQAIMARTKLAMGKKEEAAILADQLIEDSNFALSDFDKIFRGIANREEIFTFLNDRQEAGINFANNFYKPATLYVPTNTVVDLYKSNDKRKEITLEQQGDKIVLNKYDNQSSTNHLIIVRLSEMYLISAEGHGLIQGLSRLNELRAFRGLDPVSPKNEDEFLDAVLSERRKELLGEGFRWFDLVRTQRFNKVLDLDSKFEVFPIPQEQIDLNPKLKQHECWK